VDWEALQMRHRHCSIHAWAKPYWDGRLKLGGSREAGIPKKPIAGSSLRATVSRDGPLEERTETTVRMYLSLRTTFLAPKPPADKAAVWAF